MKRKFQNMRAQDKQVTPNFGLNTGSCKSGKELGNCCYHILFFTSLSTTLFTPSLHPLRVYLTPSSPLVCASQSSFMLERNRGLAKFRITDNAVPRRTGGNYQNNIQLGYNNTAGFFSAARQGNRYVLKCSNRQEQVTNQSELVI